MLLNRTYLEENNYHNRMKSVAKSTNLVVVKLYIGDKASAKFLLRHVGGLHYSCLI